MINTSIPFRIFILAVVLMALSACKVKDDSSSGGHSWSGAGGNGSPPIIWGEPTTDVLVDSSYNFTPEASDADGDVMKFSIANKPVWAEFDSASGRLRGVPGSEYVGEAAGIVISVTDDNSVVSLPAFSIAVSEQPQQGGGRGGSGGGGSDGGGGGGSGDGDSGDGEINSAPPTISGTPNNAAVIGDVYSFQPASTDPEGDTLSFSIVNKPFWASFDTTSGLLEGTPKMSDIGQSAPIELTVTDGSSISGLTPFTIRVEAAGPGSYTVDWTPPTENADGTPLTDLSGYRIYYGTSPGNYSEKIKINSPGMTSYMIPNLTRGTYYLVMTSMSRRGLESTYSSELKFRPES